MSASTVARRIASASYTYVYEPLENPYQQIRLLKLDSARDDGAVLTGSLSTHKIPLRNAKTMARFRSHVQLPPYFAVSYVWGTGTDLDRTHDIILDGRRYPITANLYTALHNYRAQTPASLWYWVDALCINQADDHEKSAQIPIMRDIYHLALAVYVWLGESTAETDRLELFLSDFTGDSSFNKLDDLGIELAGIETSSRNLGKHKQPLANIFRSETERLLMKGLTKGAIGLVNIVKLGTDTKYHSLGDHVDESRSLGLSVQELMCWSPNEKQRKRVQGEDIKEMVIQLEKILISDTQYFSRMWTLQELCVANWGLIIVPWGGLDDFLRVFAYVQRTFNISVPSIGKITNLMNVCYQFNNGHRESLWSLLFLSSGRESADPKDRIYALYGLMKDEMTSLLQPDYAKPVAEVYANTTRHLISASLNLDVLCCHGFPNRLNGLPSWVPDFRHFGLDTGTLVQASSENKIYNASLSEKHILPNDQLKPPKDWSTLTVTGISLGTVSILSDLLVPDSKVRTEVFISKEISWAKKLFENQKWTPDELEAIKTVSDLVGRYAEFYRNSNRSAFWTQNPDKLQKLRSVTGNANNQSGSAFDLHVRYFLTLICGRTAPSVRCKEEQLVEYMTRSCIPDKEGIEHLERLCTALELGTQNRRLILCEENQMGAAPLETQKGDLVYVLMGCNVPVILRKTATDNEFEFVGECYMHGFMDGEVLALRDGDKITTHEFKLV